MDQKKIVNELLELGGSLERMQKKVQELLKEFDIPEPDPRKRRNLKQIRMNEFENYLDSMKYKKRQQKKD